MTKWGQSPFAICGVSEPCWLFWLKRWREIVDYCGAGGIYLLASRFFISKNVLIGNLENAN